MPEKKKQATIAAFFSPKAARRRPTPPAGASSAASDRDAPPSAEQPVDAATPAEVAPEPKIPPKRAAGGRARGKRQPKQQQPKQNHKKHEEQEGQGPKAKKARGRGKKALFTAKAEQEPKVLISPHEVGDGDVDMDEDADENAPAASDQAIVVDGSDADVQKEEEKTLQTATRIPVEETPAEAKQSEDGNHAPTIDLTVATDSASESKPEAKDSPLTAQPAEAKGAKKRRARQSKPKTAKTTKKSAQTQSGDASAASAIAPEVQIVLDPAVQARVDTYQAKLHDLTRIVDELVAKQGATDDHTVLLQDVYGVGLDIELDVSTSSEDMTAAITKAWIDWRTSASSSSELSYAVKACIAKHTQGRGASLSSLCENLMNKLRESSSQNEEKEVETRAAMAVEMAVKMLAQRTPYGAKPPARANLFEDVTPEALWVWEIGNPEQYYKDEAHKTLKRARKHRKRLGQQLKSLARVVQLLHQKPVDEAKVSAEEVKVGKFVVAVEAELSRAKDRERKELERSQAAEEKKRAEEEKKQAKEDEKRQREQEREAEQELASKQKKTFASFFKPADADASNAPNVNASASVLPTDREASVQSAAMPARSAQAPIAIENSTEVISRMDDAIAFLGRSKSLSEASHKVTTPWKQISCRKERVFKPGSANNWSNKRHRDARRGIMKLLQFHENHRPAYYGTFSTKSHIFRGGRRPFAQFKKFDYSVDSDDEWEEEEPGESLSDADSDNGDDSDEDNLDYGDNWLAYEDEVEYMDDGEGHEYGEDDDEGDRSGEDYGDSPSKSRKRKLPTQLEQKRRKKLAKLTRLEAKVVGPLWCQTNGCSEHFTSAMNGQLLVVAAAVSFESPLMRRAREFEQQEAEKLRRKEEEAQRKLEKAAEEKVKTTPTKTPTKISTAVTSATKTPSAKNSSTKTATNKTPIKTPTKAPIKTTTGKRKMVSVSPAAATNEAATALPVGSTPQKAAITAFFQPKPKAATLTSPTAPKITSSSPGGSVATAVEIADEDEDEDIDMVPVEE